MVFHLFVAKEYTTGYKKINDEHISTGLEFNFKTGTFPSYVLEKITLHLNK